MFGYYLIIKGIKKLNNNEIEILTMLLKEITITSKIEIKEDFLVVIDNNDTNTSWEEFILGTNSELFVNLKLYESLRFNSEETLVNNLNETIKLDVFKEVYNNPQTIILNTVNYQITEGLKKHVFKELYNDLEFLRSIKVYLKENQNTSKAAKENNMHRNTLINRIEKFEKVTNLNLKDFNEAIFVYLLLKNL